MLLRLYSLLGLLSIFSACTSVQPLTSDKTTGEVTDMGYFKPFADIEIIRKGERPAYNDSLSQIVAATQLKIVHQVNPFKGSITDIEINNHEVLLKIQNEIINLVNDAGDRQIVKNILVPPVIDSILELNKKRYGLLTVNVGFTRAANNFGNQVVKGTALGILSLGMYVEAPIRANSTIYTIIADAQEDHLIFYCKYSSNGKEPLDEHVLAEQMEKTFRQYAK